MCHVKGARERLARSLLAPLGVSPDVAEEARATDGGHASEAPHTGLAAPPAQ